MFELNIKLQEKFNEISKTGKLFRVKLTGQEIWDMYLNSFSKEDNPVFRDPNSSVNNCNHCNNFIRRYGNIVSINENYKITTMFDVDDVDEEFVNTVKVLSNAIKSSKIVDVFFETYKELKSLGYENEKIDTDNDTFQLGVDKNVKRYTKEEAEKFGVVKPNEIRTFNHLHLVIDKKFVDFSNNSIEKIMHKYRDPKDLFQKAMETISLDTLNLVKDLINQGSLMDGTTHLHKIEKMIPLKMEYDELNKNQRDNWCWLKSFDFPFTRFKNELIGTLCTDLSEGMELNKACQTWNKRVDPVNYMKATAPITKKQIEEAKKFVQENGYEESFDRRFAVLDDIKVSEILHSNIGDGKIKNASIFDNVKSTSTRHKKSEFEKIEEVSIEKFMKDILPTCSSVEAFLENKHEGNLVTLTTANKSDSKKIFKWNNNYSWTFNGNLAGKSQIKDSVKSRGGNVEGVLNIRLAFPNTTDDYDLHVYEPNGNHISYSCVRKEQRSSGTLDLDAQGVDGHQQPEKRVENVIYTDINRMSNGNYDVKVRNYSGRGFHTNFIIEIETSEGITSMELKSTLGYNDVDVCSIINKNGKFEINLSNNMNLISSSTVNKEIYGLETNQFHKVNLVCLSPNHWGENNVGNKHYIFMLDKCKTNQSIRSFHNENLISDLLTHRKVMEVLGTTNMLEPTDKQLSGIGFNPTIKDELVVKVKGSHQRILKIKF